MFESVYAAELWYAGMADAAFERSITLQYCLPSATDIMVALQYPAVVQVCGEERGELRGAERGHSSRRRAAGAGERRLRQRRRERRRPRRLRAPHGRPRDRAVQGHSLDDVAAARHVRGEWTDAGPGGGRGGPTRPSPSRRRANDENTGNYTTQPHTELDCVLATLSMGPVGISDALNYTNVPLISQAFTSPTDGTLLRPSRPVSWVDSVFANMSAGAWVSCVRGAVCEGPPRLPPRPQARPTLTSARRTRPCPRRATAAASRGSRTTSSRGRRRPP